MTTQSIQQQGNIHKEAGYPVPAYTSRADGATVYNRAVTLAAAEQAPRTRPETVVGRTSAQK